MLTCYKAKESVLNIVVLLLCCSMPFTHVNHTILYILFEIIGVYGLIYLNQQRQLISADPFMRYYGYFLIWGIFVTLLSVNIGISAKGLTVLLLLLPICAGLYDGCGLKRINTYLAITSVILFILNLMIFCYQHFHITWLALFAHIGGGKIDSSSLAVYIIVYTMFFNVDKIKRLGIIGINLVSGIMLKDANFIVTMTVIFLLHYALICRQVAWYKIIIVLICLLLGLKYVLIDLGHFNLHIYERTLIYSYWLPKLFYSPIHGIGLSLKLESRFFPSQFPISPIILAIDGHIKLHAHNYFLDLVLQTGFIGLVLMLLFYYKICKCTYVLANVRGLSVTFMLIAVLMKNMIDDTLEGARFLLAGFFIVLAYVTVLNLYKHVTTKIKQ